VWLESLDDQEISASIADLCASPQSLCSPARTTSPTTWGNRRTQPGSNSSLLSSGVLRLKSNIQTSNVGTASSRYATRSRLPTSSLTSENVPPCPTKSVLLTKPAAHPLQVVSALDLLTATEQTCAHQSETVGQTPTVQAMHKVQ
jgi:hypothetical protein